MKKILLSSLILSSALVLVSAQDMATSSPTFNIKESWKTFKMGVKNEEVKGLQNLLIKKGILPQGNDTGYFGPKTNEAFNKLMKMINENPNMGMTINVGTSTFTLNTSDFMPKNASNTMSDANKALFRADLSALATSTKNSCEAMARDTESKLISIMQKYNPNFVLPTNQPSDRYVRICEAMVRSVPAGLAEDMKNQKMPMGQDGKPQEKKGDNGQQGGWMNNWNTNMPMINR